MKENLLPFDGEVYYYPDVFSKTESDRYFEVLLSNIHWAQEPVTLFGKQIMQPRLTALYGDASKSYTYSGITMKPQQWIAELLEIKTAAEHISGDRFSTVLLNHYRNGEDSMGWHRDNEKALGPQPVIASVSFGAERNFQLRHYRQRNVVISVVLGHGSILLMRGMTQEHWQHRLPKSAKLLNTRINLTFRRLIS